MLLNSVSITLGGLVNHPLLQRTPLMLPPPLDRCRCISHLLTDNQTLSELLLMPSATARTLGPRRKQAFCPGAHLVSTVAPCCLCVTQCHWLHPSHQGPELRVLHDVVQADAMSSANQQHTTLRNGARSRHLLQGEHWVGGWVGGWEWRGVSSRVVAAAENRGSSSSV